MNASLKIMTPLFKHLNNNSELKIMCLIAVFCWQQFSWSIDDRMSLFWQLQLSVDFSHSVFKSIDLNLILQIEINTSEHTVTEIYTQLQLSEQWHSVTYWLQKLLPAKDNYETHDLEFLAIIEMFKQWCHYLEKSTHPVKILMDHNNFHEFMNI